jgi:hypothetical protein
VSKRHQSHRRRAYGRRQHELHERTERRRDHGRIEFEWSDPNEAPQADPLTFFDPRSPRLRFGFSD